MLYTLISQQCALWFQQPDCPARSLVAYMEARGCLRDAQIDAIKTYLFLKLEGKNKPLWELFCDGLFVQKEDLANLHINEAARKVFESNAPARALFEFARRKEEGSAKPLFPTLEKYLMDNPASVDCGQVIRQVFYGVAYPDYLFSLPMGAGKTFLMAAIIYLDLYFAQSEPENKLFAHNFILLVPSGLKSSIIPSLKTIEKFDPTWVLPEPAASRTRKLIKFEILDQPKSAQKSNKARNPNAQKVSQHQPFADLMGLVIVTNAEKVILDKVKTDALGIIEESDDEKSKAANELRHLIGKVPNLQILIDEVHHAATDEIKLRQVVNQWSKGGNINGVLGFSGTPYLAKADELTAAPGVSLASKQIANTVFYYPLTRAIQRFLKKPQVETITGLSSPEIVRQGVTAFLKQYGEKKYAGGATAKLAIYCGSIERLETEVYPLLIGEMGIPPGDILRYHRGNKEYPAHAGAESEWKSLDTAVSEKRIILLVQIGKEGWDCRSLTGVILSQKGDCPPNMVLQTSCRCLRQMDGGTESAGIWLNADNAKVLDKQLEEEQKTSIAELNKLGKGEAAPTRPRVSRMEHLRLPPVKFYQLRVTYQTLETGEATPEAALTALNLEKRTASTRTGGLLSGGAVSQRFHTTERGELADFPGWLLSLAKGSFGAVSLSRLRPFEPRLRAIFDTITDKDGDTLRFNTLYDAEGIAAQIRLAFYAPRTFQTSEENISAEARLLLADKLDAVEVSAKNLYPSEADTAKILDIDASGESVFQYAQAQRAKIDFMREMAKSQGFDPNLFTLPDIEPTTALVNKDRSFHVVPYQFDSSFELKFLQEALTLDILRERVLEIYFNGAGELTEFRIECFRRVRERWSSVGKYTPDFLLIERKDGAIYRALIIETKGSGYADQPAFKDRRTFVDQHFVPRNNAAFGYDRFQYLYLTDADDLTANTHKLCAAATAFFTD